MKTRPFVTETKDSEREQAPYSEYHYKYNFLSFAELRA